jgi:catechol 2,3-dioxygenase
MIADATTLGSVRLTVADIDQVGGFYRRVIGLRDDALVALASSPDAPARARGTTGLFHLALLVPSRAELARAIRRVVDNGWKLSGASDHLVSEAVYLSDPEGNGIEIYRDRPRAEWRHTAGGELAMDTLPLDLDSVMAEEPADSDPGIAEGTTIGHVHLNVASIPDADRYWCDTVGFEAVVRGYPGALFVAAGGYHHHLGLNVWNGVGAPAPPRGTRGLDHFTINVTPTDQAAIAARAVAVEDTEHGPIVTDPSGNRALLARM